MGRTAVHPGIKVKARDREGNVHTFKGHRFSVVLDSAGVTLGPELKGKNLTKIRAVARSRWL